MLKPILCGNLQLSATDQKGYHGLIKSVEKNTFRASLSNQSSQTKSKKSLKCNTNRPNKPTVASQFKNQAYSQKNELKFNNLLRYPAQTQRQNGRQLSQKKGFNSNYAFDQNRRKFMSINLNNSDKITNKINLPQSKNQPHFLYQPNQRQSINQILQRSQVSSNINTVHAQKINQNIPSQIANGQKLTFLGNNIVNNPLKGQGKKDSISLKHHFSVPYFRLSQKQNDKKVQSKQKIQSPINRPLFRTSSVYLPTNNLNYLQQSKLQGKLSTFRNKGQSLYGQQIYKSSSKEQLNQKRLITDPFKEKNPNTPNKQNLNTASMPRFFSLKTSRFFIEKKQKQQENQKSKQSEITKCEESNIDLEQIDCSNRLQNKKKNSQAINQNIVQFDRKSNYTSQTSDSNILDLNSWKKREVDNRFSLRQTVNNQKFGTNSLVNQSKIQRKSAFIPQLKSQQTQRAYFPFLKQPDQKVQSKISQKSKQNDFTNTQRPKIERFSNTVSPFISREASRKSSFIGNTFRNEENKKQQEKEVDKNQQIRIQRCPKARPSFFADIQRQCFLRTKEQKKIQQKVEQDNEQTQKTVLQSTLEVRDAQSVVDSQFEDSQTNSEVEFVLHSTEKFHIKSFALLQTQKLENRNFLKYK